MESIEILNILNDSNFWNRDLETGLQRKNLLKRIDDLSKTKEIVVVTGLRRSGKSTLLLQHCKSLIGKGVKKEDILIINFEDPRFKGLDLQMLNSIYEIYLTELNPSEKHHIILDEVQVVKSWEKFARYAHENKKASVFVTGSSSKLLSSEYSTVLAGRHVDITVRPLSFKEFLSFKGIHIDNTAVISAERHAIKRAFSEYMKWGGFPKITLLRKETEKREVLGVYFRDIIIKDIVMRYNIKEIQKLEDLAKYYLTNISSLQSFNRIKNVLKANLDTIERFSYYLNYAFLLSFVPKFSYSKKEQILNPKKVYSSDIGLRNIVAFTFSKDYGRLAENIVFNALNTQNNEIYYWKGKHEVDFIIRERNKTREAIQVCWNIQNSKTKDREINGLIEACKALKLKEGTIITEDVSHKNVIDGIKIMFIPLWLWLVNQ